MMNNQEYSELKANDMLYARESLMMNVTEDILVTMEDKNISKASLAKLLDKSKAFVTQMLGGSRNMTLRTLSDIAFALDMEVSIKFVPKKKAVDYGVDENQWENSNVVLLPSCYRIISKATPIAEDYQDWQKSEAA
jgi:transcriptional regulator with XRE-family HTH domain